MKFEGCGDPPETHNDVGFCSQIAVFKRKSWDDYLLLREEKAKEALMCSAKEEPYKVIDAFDFPFDKTARIANQLMRAVDRCCSEVAGFEENIDRLPRDETGNFLEVKEENENPQENQEAPWNIVQLGEERDKVCGRP